MSKTKDNEQDVFYVGIYDKVNLRRNILESLKYGIENLQSYEKLKEITEVKEEKLDKLRRNLKDINSMINDMKDALPKTGLKAKPKPKKKVKKIEAVKKKVIEKPKKMSELAKLENDLKDIEGKLNGLV